MVYNGPDLVMINTTNMCMTEIFDWDLGDGSLKGITCEDSTEGLRTTKISPLWIEGSCNTPPISERMTQVREIDNSQRIYCFKQNITINKKTCSCLDYVFEIDNSHRYTINDVAYASKPHRRMRLELSDRIFVTNILPTIGASNTSVKGDNISDWKISVAKFKKELYRLKGRLRSGSKHLLEGISLPNVPLSELPKLMDMEGLEHEEFDLSAIMRLATSLDRIFTEMIERAVGFIRIAVTIIIVAVALTLIIVIWSFISPSMRLGWATLKILLRPVLFWTSMMQHSLNKVTNEWGARVRISSIVKRKQHKWAHGRMV